MAPSSTLLILSELVRQAGHTTELIDTRLHMNLPAHPDGQEWTRNFDTIEANIANSDAEIIGMSFLSSSAIDAYQVAALCKKQHKTVIAGGLHATVAANEVIESGIFDYIYQGEAETAFVHVLKQLEEGQLPRFPAATHIIQAPPLALQQMSSIPTISDFSYYDEVLMQHPRFRAVYVELSRGCVKNCAFCEVAKSGLAFKPFRPIPLDRVYPTLERAIEDHGANYVLVSDSIATLYKKHFLEFITFMRRTYPQVAIQFNSTVDRWDEEIAAAVADMQCSVWFGFESGSQRILDMISKGTTVEQAHQAARTCEQYQIACGFNILMGIPNETRNDYELTLRFFEQHRHIYPNPNILNPLPGTAMYRYVRDHDLLRYPQDYSIWDAKRIKAADYAGPIIGVNYKMMLDYHAKLSALQQEQERQLGS